MSTKFKIGVMGAATGTHSEENLKKAEEVGKAIVENDCIMLYGATIGFPLAAAKGAKSADGTVLGVSPAVNEKEHLEKYKYPVELCDAVIYTGFGFSGRNTILVRSCDAVIIINGRSGTMIEFGVAYAEEKVIGVLTGTEGIADKVKELEELFAGKSNTKIIYESNPEKLIEKVVAELKQNH